MDEILSGLVTMIILVFMFVTGPIYSSFERADRAADNYVNVTASRFQKEVRSNGYVDYSTYLKFRSSLMLTKKDYDVEMIHESKEVFPKEGSYDSYFIEHGNTQILNTIEHDKKYEMSYGDEFTVTVKEKGHSDLQILNFVLYGNTPQDSYIFAKYGGEVQNEE